MLPAATSGDASKRTAAENQTVRDVFVIGPDSLQLTATHKVATPAQWKQGDDVIIAGSVTDDEASKAYPLGWKAPRPYIRIVPQPKA
jgi:alkyl hydroperoxide reductase subunit AhpC